MNDIQPITLPGIDPRRPLVIAGPCSAETEEQVLDTARSLAAEGIRICRAGLWKPRTKPGGFEGVGEAGIAWLQRVKRETGMYTSTEVATREHVATALKGGVDLLWIGARTAANPFAMQEIADALRGTDVPVLVKNPVSPDLELSRRSTRASTATTRCGPFPSSCTAASPACRSSATRATSEASAS